MTNCQEEIIGIQKILESAREFVNVFYPKLIEARDILQNLSIDIEGQTTTIRICGKRLKCIDKNIVSEATVNKLAQVAVFEYLFYCFDTNENLVGTETFENLEVTAGRPTIVESICIK